MVFFICNSCGDSLKKPQVDQHLGKKGGYAKCRGCSISCMDCHRDFDANSYVHHTKCITEQEKYSGGNFTHKASTVNKQGKRDQWTELIGTVAARKDPGRTQQVQGLLDFLAGKETVPNKEKAFMNFMSTVPSNLKNYRAAIIAWKLLNEERNLNLKSAESNITPELNVLKETKREEAANEDSSSETASSPELWMKAIKKLAESGGPFEDTFQVLAGQSDVPVGPKKVFKAYVKKLLPSSKNIANMWTALNLESDILKKDAQNPTNGKAKKRARVTEEEYNSKKAKLDEEQQTIKVKNGKFPWKKAVELALSSSKAQSLSMKKLNRKVLAEFDSLRFEGLIFGAESKMTKDQLDVKLTKVVMKMTNVVPQEGSKQTYKLKTDSS